MESKKYIQDIAEIKDLMNRSSKFLSLSGMSGIMAGIYALTASYLVYITVPEIIGFDNNPVIKLDSRDVLTLVLIGSVTLLLSVVTGIFMTRIEANKNNEKLWNASSRLLLINLMIPLAAGGVLVLIFLSNGLAGLIAPTTLIFYGLALVNASKFTHDHIRILGFAEVVLGLTAAYFMANGLIFWAAGFGLFHILYGVYMYKNQR